MRESILQSQVSIMKKKEKQKNKLMYTGLIHNALNTCSHTWGERVKSSKQVLSISYKNTKIGN